MSRCLVSIKESIELDKLIEASSILQYNSNDKVEYFYKDEIFISWSNSGETVYYKKFNNANDVVVLIGNFFSTKYSLDEFVDIAYASPKVAFQYLDGYVILLVKKNDEFFIANDMLGFLKLYTHNEYKVYSTELKCLKHLFNLTINKKAMSQKHFSFFTTNLPLLNNLSFYPSGTMYEIKNKIVINEINRKLEFEETDLDDKQIILKINELLKDSYVGYRLLNENHNISLSGGFDSRFVLGKSLELANKVTSSTFSGTKDLENEIAKKLAKVTNIKHNTFLVKKFDFNIIEKYVHDYEEVSSVDSLFYTEFIQFINHDSILISGLLTDLLTGSHLKFSNHIDPINFLLNSSQTALGVSDIKNLDMNFIEKYLYDEFTDLNAHYKDYQSITLLNMQTRQKLWVSFVYKAVLNTGRGVVPTYNQKFIEFMLSLPFDKLQNQYAYRKFFRVIYPNLAKVDSTFDFQPIEESNSMFKNMKKFILKQFYRFTQKYSTIEMIELNHKELLIFIQDNKSIFDEYFTQTLYHDLEYSLNNFTQFKRYFNKFIGKRILTDISIMIVVNTIVFHKIFTKSINIKNVETVKAI